MTQMSDILKGKPFRLKNPVSCHLSDLLQQAACDDCHFFIKEAVAQNLIPVDKNFAEKGEKSSYQLLKIEHQSELSDIHFKIASHLNHTTLYELLLLSVVYPDIQQSLDILALDTMRWRKVYDNQPGETLWGSFSIEQSMCQWVFALTGHKNAKRLMPVELFLGQVLKRDAFLLTRLA